MLMVGHKKSAFFFEAQSNVFALSVFIKQAVHHLDKHRNTG